jgi:hypothetical protein
MSQEKLSQKQEPTIQTLKEREDLHIDLKQELCMMENGLVDSEMDMEFKNGQMVHVMKVSGEIIEPMVKVNLLTLMVIFMRENGSTIKLMEREYIII